MLIKELPYNNPHITMRAFADLPGSVFFDGGGCGYSFIAVDPFFVLKNASFKELNEKISEFPLETHPGLPPFQGGAAGYWGYDLCATLENIQLQPADYLYPSMMVGLYDLVIAFDHAKKTSWVFSSGYPELKKQAREIRAQKRLNWIVEKTKDIHFINNENKYYCDVQSNFSQIEYCKAVEKVIQYILDGDIFETNIAQRFHAKLPAVFSAYELYTRLCDVNAAPFSSYLNWGDVKLVSASPERFLSVKNRVVETKPIKGTAPRGKTEKEDQQFGEQLLNSEKDKAENVMIVDLMRNDLSKVCQPESVVVNKFCELESFATVHHLVSTINADLSDNCSSVDLLEACFPGGSITGAPKVRSMEIIAEIEPHRRGPYCGAIGYVGFNGDMDTSITIRTYAIKDDFISFHGGGAIVLDSDPEQEYQETLDKVGVLKKVLSGVENDIVD